MANPFDQFDTPAQANPFDQFDTTPFDGATPEQAAMAQQSPSFAQRLMQLPVIGPLARAQGAALDLGASALTGTAAAIPAGLSYFGAAGAKMLGADVSPSQVMGNVQEALTFSPQTQTGQQAATGLGNLVRPVVEPIARGYGNLTESAEGISPALGAVMREAPSTMQAVTGVLPVVAAARPAAQAIRAARTLPDPEAVISQLDSAQSMGAAAASPRLTDVSPELRLAISKSAQRTGGSVNPEALARQLEADSLPVKMRLTEGQALQDVVKISNEQNRRGKFTELAYHFDEENKKLGRNMQALRDEVGPDVFSTNPVEHADTLIAAYKAKDRIAQDEIKSSYQALRDANGGQFPVDANALLTNASTALHQNLLFDHAPRAVMSTLNRLATAGNMTFENFESLRTNLARIQRSTTADGNEKAAAHIIREAMEQLPLQPGAAAMKPLADAARNAARTQFEALRADPAYMAAVMDEVAPDRFVQRYVIGAPRDDVARMQANLAQDPRALQTMGVAALDYLRDAARLNPHYSGDFASASYNKGLQALGPKLSSLVPASTAENLEKLGNVSRYMTAQGRGSFVNNSNTAVAAMAEGAAGAAEGITNVAAAGIPIGTWTRKALESAGAKRTVRKAIAPGAGLDQLTSPQVEAMLEAARRKSMGQ